MRLLSAFCCLFVVSTALGQRHEELPIGPVDVSKIGKAEVKYISKQQLSGGVTVARLTNGMTVIVQENHAAPVATVRSFVANTGSAFEGKYLGSGISHLLEHLVAGGSTTKRSEKEIQAILDSLGGNTNAYTSNEVTAYHIDCPAKNVTTAIELVADSMQYAAIVDDEYQREMGVVQRELEMGEAQRSRVLYQAVKSLLFQNHPMKHPTIGYLGVLQKLQQQDAKDFYKDRYVPQNMVFVVVGDVNTSKVLDAVLNNFKDFHRTTERAPTLQEEPEQASPRWTTIKMEGATAQIALAWPTVRLQHEDLYALDVASFVLTNGDSSRLVRRLEIDEPLVLNVSSSSYTPGFVRGWFQISAECKPENLEKVQKIILEEVDRLKKEPVSENELAKVKRQKAAEHVFGQQTVEAQAEGLANSFLATGDPLFDNFYVEGIQKVTPAQVQEVAQRYFVPERLNTAIIEPLGDSSAEELAVSEGEAETPIMKKQLSNGMTVLIKKSTVLPLVNIQAFSKGGSISDTEDTAGLASLAAELMDKGTEKYSAEQIAEYFDSIGGSMGVASQRNSTFLQAAVLKDDFTTALDYVYQVLFAPKFPTEEFDKAKQIRLGRIAAMSANPQSEIMDFWAKQLPGSSPYSRTVLGTEETVSKLTAEDCKKFHKNYIVPNNMVLAVFGDIDVDETMKLLESTFGQLPKSDSFTWPKYPLTTELESSKREHLTMNKANTAMILMSYPSASIYDTKTRGALEMLQAVLAGGAGGRLHDELRGAQLVYYVHGFDMTGFAPGYFCFLSQTRPETVDQVISRIQANLDKIAKEGIPEDEFNKARDKLIASHAMSNTTPSEQAFQACIDELYGFGYDYDKGFEERLRKVTVADVMETIKTHFTQSIIVTSSPEPAKSPKAPEAN
jgi:zinc protease